MSEVSIRSAGVHPCCGLGPASCVLFIRCSRRDAEFNLVWQSDDDRDLSKPTNPEKSTRKEKHMTVDISTPNEAEAVPASGAPTPAQVRAWAVENGYDVGKRGRLPRSVFEAYDQAQAWPALF